MILVAHKNLLLTNILGVAVIVSLKNLQKELKLATIQNPSYNCLDDYQFHIKQYNIKILEVIEKIHKLEDKKQLANVEEASKISQSHPPL